MDEMWLDIAWNDVERLEHAFVRVRDRIFCSFGLRVGGIRWMVVFLSVLLFPSSS